MTKANFDVLSAAKARIRSKSLLRAPAFISARNASIYAMKSLKRNYTNQTIMMSLSMVVIASLIGAGGLGSAVMRSLAIVDVGAGFESGLCIVVLTMLLDRIIRTDSRRPGDNTR